MVTITGSHFRNVTGVSFGGVPASSFTVNSVFSISAVVAGGASGDVTVTTTDSTVSRSGFGYFLAPSITSFTPTTAITGTQVVITGTNFTGTTAVSFGGVAASFTINSPTSITATVISGVSGNVSVTNPAGTATLGGFTFIPPPSLSTVSPSMAGEGSVINLYGTHLDIVTAVSFGGVAAASFTIVSPTQITAILGAGASGTVKLQSPAGEASMPSFIFVNKPTVTAFTPASTFKGKTVTITGTNFMTVKEVRFGGAPAASFTVMSPTSITALVDTGATGKVKVVTSGGADSLAGFTFLTVPVIASFTPTSASSGTPVTITGTGFTGITGVQFGGVPAASFTVNSASSITAQVGAGASGDVTVIGSGGNASLQGFVFTTITAIVSPNTNDPKGLVVFPNPANSIVYIRHPASFKKATLTLIDIRGKTVRQIIPGRSVTQTMMDVRGLAAGIYEIVWAEGNDQLRQTLMAY
jgi:hypothetical protein